MLNKKQTEELNNVINEKTIRIVTKKAKFPLISKKLERQHKLKENRMANLRFIKW